MTAAVDIETEGRRGRLFARGAVDLTETAVRRAANQFMDEQDTLRAEALRALLATGHARAMVHPEEEPDDDVLHVYLRELAGGPRVFACVIVSSERVERMLAEEGSVLEGFTLQVVNARHLTLDAIRAALEAWTERNFPGTPLPLLMRG